MARMVVRSKPSAAKRRLAAARIAALVAWDRGEKLMPTSVGQRVLTTSRGLHYPLVNTRWQTIVGKGTRMPELTSSTEVLIVGAGPVGMTLAAALTARGVEVALVDKAAEGANTSRAAVIHARTLEALRGIEVSDELVRR